MFGLRENANCYLPLKQIGLGLERACLDDAHQSEGQEKKFNSCFALWAFMKIPLYALVYFMHIMSHRAVSLLSTTKPFALTRVFLVVSVVFGGPGHVQQFCVLINFNFSVFQCCSSKK